VSVSLFHNLGIDDQSRHFDEGNTQTIFVPDSKTADGRRTIPMSDRFARLLRDFARRNVLVGSDKGYP